MFHPVLFALCRTVFIVYAMTLPIFVTVLLFSEILCRHVTFLLSCKNYSLDMLHVSVVMLIVLLMSCKTLAVAVLEFFAASAGTHVIASRHLVLYYRICIPVACRL